MGRYILEYLAYLVFFLQYIVVVQAKLDIDSHDAHQLHSTFDSIFRATGERKLEIFCYSGETQTMSNILKTVELVVKVPNENFDHYQGSNSSAVKLMKEDSSWLRFNPWKPNSFKMELFQSSCVGIETEETFRVYLKVRHLDLWRVLVLASGVVLFLLAPLFANNPIFHYGTGVSVGVFGSMLVIIFILSRFLPKKTGAAAFLIGGWGLVLYGLQYIWNNCISLMKEYQSVVIGYVVLASFISFAVVYRYGPIKDQRSLHLVKWSLQLVGLMLIFVSSDCKEFTVAIMIALLCHHNIPKSWVNRWKTFWFRYFPPKQRFLSEDEYLEQSRIETKKALEDLRSFCNSPDCNAWKTMSKLSSPQRFAEFVGGESHLMDDEILSYEVAEFSLPEDDIVTSDDSD